MFATPEEDVRRLLTSEGVALTVAQELGNTKVSQQFEDYVYVPSRGDYVDSPDWHPPSVSLKDLPDFVRLALRQFPQVRKIVEGPMRAPVRLPRRMTVP